MMTNAVCRQQYQNKMDAAPAPGPARVAWARQVAAARERQLAVLWKAAPHVTSHGRPAGKQVTVSNDCSWPSSVQTSSSEAQGHATTTGEGASLSEAETSVTSWERQASSS